MKDLSQLRTEIDTLDREILAALQRRMALVTQVGQYKKQQGLPVVDLKRWNEVLASKLALAAEYKLDTAMVKDIYNRIHEAAIRLEKTLQ